MDGLLNHHRMARDGSADEDARISLRSGMQLKEASAIETGCPDFGARPLAITLPELSEDACDHSG